MLCVRDLHSRAAWGGGSEWESCMSARTLPNAGQRKDGLGLRCDVCMCSRIPETPAHLHV